MTRTSEIGPAVGSALSAAGAAASWVSGNPFLTAVLAAAAGSFVTIYFAGVQQRQAWRRETAVRMTTELYGPLYVDVWKAVQAFSGFQRRYRSQSGSYHSEVWPAIVEDYRYRVIEKDMRARLDQFYLLVEETSTASNRVVELTGLIFLECTRDVLRREDISTAIWGCNGITRVGQRGSMGGFNPVFTIAQGESEMDDVRKSMPDYQSYVFPVQLVLTTARQEQLEVTEEQAGRVFAATETRLRTEKLYIDREKKRSELLKSGATLREQLGIIVEQPWKS